MITAEYCQKSKDGLCRINALNNALGYDFITAKQFYKVCDEYDEKYNLSHNFSRQYFSVANSNFDNIFSYILHKTNKYITKYIQMDTLTPNELKNCNSVIVFNNNHTWALRRSIHNNNDWLEIDRKVKNIRPGKTQSFIGAILICLKQDETISEKPIISNTQKKKEKREQRKLRKQKIKQKRKLKRQTMH